MYFAARAHSSELELRQSITDWGKEEAKSLNILMREMRSVGDPFAALSRTCPAKTTSLWAVSSSRQGTIVVGSESLFCSHRPLIPVWMISLSVRALAIVTSTKRRARTFLICRLITICMSTNLLLNIAQLPINNPISIVKFPQQKVTTRPLSSSTFCFRLLLFLIAKAPQID